MSSEHVCGLMGFGRLGDTCPACNADSANDRCEGCGKPSVTADSDGIPLCRECADACDDRVESIKHAPVHIAPPSETKLKEAIDAIVLAGNAEGYSRCAQQLKDRGYGASIRKAMSDVESARSSLESLYRELLDEKRIAEASFCAFHTREYLFAGLPIHRKAIECRNEEIDSLRSDLSALRSLQLTESEDWQLDQAIEDAEALPRPDVQIECLRGILEKLRRISSKATSEEL